jgi:hypothetical protein
MRAIFTTAKNREGSRAGLLFKINHAEGQTNLNCTHHCPSTLYRWTRTSVLTGLASLISASPTVRARKTPRKKTLTVPLLTATILVSCLLYESASVNTRAIQELTPEITFKATLEEYFTRVQDRSSLYLSRTGREAATVARVGTPPVRPSSSYPILGLTVSRTGTRLVGSHSTNNVRDLNQSRESPHAISGIFELI